MGRRSDRHDRKTRPGCACRRRVEHAARRPDRAPFNGQDDAVPAAESNRRSTRPTGGRHEAHVGIAQVPDPRLDRLTELFEPQRRVPATVEITELAGYGATRSLIDVTAFRDADALLHVLRMFRDERVPHVAGEVDPARDATQMEDEADPGRPRCGRATAGPDSTDAKKGKNRELEEGGASRRAVSGRPGGRSAAPGALAGRRRRAASPRVQLPLGQAGARRPEPRRS